MSSDVGTNGNTNGLPKTHQNGDTNGSSTSRGEHEELQYLDLIKKIIETGENLRMETQPLEFPFST